MFLREKESFQESFCLEFRIQNVQDSKQEKKTNDTVFDINAKDKTLTKRKKKTTQLIGQTRLEIKVKTQT